MRHNSSHSWSFSFPLYLLVADCIQLNGSPQNAVAENPQTPPCGSSCHLTMRSEGAFRIIRTPSSRLLSAVFAHLCTRRANSLSSLKPTGQRLRKPYITLSQDLTISLLPCICSRITCSISFLPTRVDMLKTTSLLISYASRRMRVESA